MKFLLGISFLQKMFITKMDLVALVNSLILSHLIYTETRGHKGGVSVLDGIRAAVSPETEVLYERGCNFLGQALHPFDPSMLRDENGESG